jgi:predicted cupin superfamily sugar epimerase
MTDSRAAELIATLELTRHPEGGWYREIHRSERQVEVDDGRGRRAATTLIYFLLTAEEVSRWHRVTSDEIWHFCEGSPLELAVMDAGFERASRPILSPLAMGGSPVHVIAAGKWQAARTTGPYSLVACAVGPGFDFADFAMLRDLPNEARLLRARQPDLESYL